MGPGRLALSLILLSLVATQGLFSVLREPCTVCLRINVEPGASQASYRAKPSLPGVGVGKLLSLLWGRGWRGCEQKCAYLTFCRAGGKMENTSPAVTCGEPGLR